MKKLGVDTTSCNKKDMNFEYFLYNIVNTSDYRNAHWEPIWNLVGEKWWPYMTFISNMEDVSGDSERLLRSVSSSIDNVTLWDRLGSTGWGSDMKHCEDATGDDAFNSFNMGGKHSHNADLLLKQMYSPETEAFVEAKYSVDLHNPYYSFSPLKIFPSDDEEDE